MRARPREDRARSVSGRHMKVGTLIFLFLQFFSKDEENEIKNKGFVGEWCHILYFRGFAAFPFFVFLHESGCRISRTIAHDVLFVKSHKT